MERFDAIVVGAGNGGLTAAAGLAQKGLKVLLLERHNIPGGCATSFCRGRFEFEVALHQLSGMGSPEKPGPLRMALESLGVLDHVEPIEMTDLYSVLMPDGFRLALKAEKDATVSLLRERFPAERDAVEKFFDLCYRFANELISAFYFKDPDTSRDKYPVLYEYAFKPACEVLEGFFKDPLLKAVLSVYWGYIGLPPTRMSFAYLALLFFTYMEFKPYHFKGGSQALSNALIHRFLSNGGTVRFNCGVEKILVQEGRVRGVLTEHGDRYEADHVVSNVSQILTYVELMEPEHVPGGVFREMRGRSLSPSAFTLFIGLDCEPGVVGITETTNFLLDNLDFSDRVLNQMQALDIEDQLLVLSCYDVADPEFSPSGACQLNLVTLKYGEAWLRVPPTRYFETKYRVAESMMRRVEDIFPGVRAHVEELDVATPMTHMRYLGHPFGAIYGWEMYPKDTMFFQPGRLSPIEGLYFASGWSGDCGFQPTLEAGMSAANAIYQKISGE